MKEFRKIITPLLISFFIFICAGLAADYAYGMSIDNPAVSLTSISGEDATTTADGKPKILFFFNRSCSHCDRIESAMQEKGFDPDKVDIIAIECYATPFTKSEAEDFYRTKETLQGLPLADKCYDGSSACWQYLHLCGHKDSIVIKPVIFFISAENKVVGYATPYKDSNLDIYRYAFSCGIDITCPHQCSWHTIMDSPEYMKDGFSYEECDYCYKTRNYQTLKGLGPAATSIRVLYRGNKSFRITWKRPSKSNLNKTSGYQIMYSHRINFDSNKTITVKNRNCTSLRITALKSHYRYYVKIRTYASSGTRKYYSDWSDARIVKTR